MASSISDGPLLPGENTEAVTPRWAALSGLIVVLAATTLVGALHPSLPKLGGTPAPYAVGDPGPGSLGAILPPTARPGPTPNDGTAAKPAPVPVARRGAVAHKARTAGAAAPAPRLVIRVASAAPVTRAPVGRVPVVRSPVVRTPSVPAPVGRPARARVVPAPVVLAPVVRSRVVTKPVVPAPVVPAPVEPKQVVATPIGQAPIVPVPTVTSPVVPKTKHDKAKGKATSGEPKHNASGRSADHSNQGKGPKHRG